MTSYPKAARRVVLLEALLGGLRGCEHFEVVGVADST